MSDAEGALSGSVRVDGVRVTLRGDVDTETVPILTDLLDEALAAGTGLVTVDLSDVSFMDARGLTALVHAASRLSGAGRQLAVVAPAGMRRLFDITDLTRLLGVEESPRAGGESILTSAAEAPGRQNLLDAALKVVVTMTQAVVTGADGASITLPRKGKLGTVAASNDVVRDMDGDQYDTGEGPCLDAATQGKRFHITSLDEEQRWPEFVPRARARGIRSILSTPLMVDDTSFGALNIYSSSVDAFADHEQQWADTFAAGAAAVVNQAHAGLVPDDIEAQLQLALESREVIALAQGITMGRVGGTAEQAHAVLRDVGVRTNQSLLEVCSSVIAALGGSTAGTPAPPGGEHELDPV